MDTNIFEKLTMPISLQLEITNHCNMRCGFCYNDSGFDRKNDLTINEWINFSRTVVNNGGVFQLIISGGEPTLYKDNVIKLLDLYDKDHTVFKLITNGTGIDEVFADKLSKYNWYWVQISLDSHNSEKHNKIRNYNGAWEKAVTAIKILRKNKIPVSIASVIYEENIDDMEELIKLAISLNVNQIIFSSVLYSGRAINNLSYYNKIEDFKIRYNKLYETYHTQIIMQIAATYKEQLTKILTEPSDSLIVRPNGDVKIDCVLPIKVGNIRNDNIVNIWNKSKTIYENESFIQYINSLINNSNSVG